ncbi:MAG TPA: VOC family protein [Acidimicrobiales bacterium]|nr:VOC family protein [Acidimicrobiales bacterium]
MDHPVVHFEILGPDGPALQNYYTELFGWKIDSDNPPNYGIVTPIAPGIGGGVSASQDGTSFLSFYVATDDLQASLDRAVSLGGTKVMDPTDIPGGPSVAMFTDPQGNTVGLVKGM